MSTREQLRSIRRLAMQVLYQMDVTGETDPQTLRDSLDEEHDSPATADAAVELATAAWQDRKQTDRLVHELAPDWPTHRQPPVDRAILRLAHHEMTSGRVPVKIAINEAVELAKQYGSEHSPPFVNGVLDKLAKSEAIPAPQPHADVAVTEDAWLRDAMKD